MLHTLAGFLIVKSLDQLLWKRFQNAGKSSERISANAQLARKRNSYANFVQNQSKNREWIRTTKTAWSESTETDTANQTLLVPTNMYIIQLHTWECVLLNKLVQTLCLWNNLCIIDCIAGVTLLDHLLWKHRSLESSWQNQNHPTNRCKNSKNPVTLWCKKLVRPLYQINQKTIQHRRKTLRHHFHNHLPNSSPSLPKLNGCGIIFQQILYVCEIILKSCSRIFQLFQIF